jgi:hypothetical protein
VTRCFRIQITQISHALRPTLHFSICTFRCSSIADALFSHESTAGLVLLKKENASSYVDKNKLYCHVFGRNHRRGSNWCLELPATYTHDSELQAIAVSPLISIIQKSAQHPLSLFQPAMLSPAAPWQRFLTVEALRFMRSGST